MAPPPMNIRWTVQAAGDLESVHDYLSESSVRSADAVVDRILSAIDQLERFPNLGRAGRVEGTRELVIVGTPFIVAYRLAHNQVEILAVLHGARKWPSTF